MSRELPCWKCGVEYSVPDHGLPFRADCEACGRYLHCCKNCKHYKPGLPNDCRIPDTEQVADREAFNFCDSFSPLGEQESRGSMNDAAKKLFGDDDTDQAPTSFDSLFRD